VAKQYSVTYDQYDNWKLPLNLAVGFHLLIGFSIIFLPNLLKSRPKFEDIYTVNLIEISEPAAEAASPVQPQLSTPQPEPQPEPVKAENQAPVLEPTKPVPAPAPVKAVSIKPLKRKIKKTIKPEPVKDNSRQKELEKIKRQNIAEALKAEQLAAEQARIAAEEAAIQQKLLEQQLRTVKNQVTSNTSATTRRTGTSGAKSALSTQYLGTVMNHVIKYWALPEFKTWDPDLTAVVVITISQSGKITNQFFEKRSGDPTFDQFVRKTLQDADPLPAIPPALREQKMEIGLRFRPGSIQ